MKSNYKKLGELIRSVNVRNTELQFDNLLGINIDKYFMPSVANTVGTDMTVYKVVTKNQFACNRMHVGRDFRLPVALSKSEEAFIVSPAYDVFEIIDMNLLLPEYLMMWFSREEFDRNAWFHTDADVRGGLPWESLCDMQLPVPEINEQREIVNEYDTIKNCNKLNDELIQKLEESALAIYKNWFIDFEFPDENGMPYKSSGGEMVESSLGEIPKGWRVGLLGEIIALFDSKRIPLAASERMNMRKIYPYYGAASLMDYVDDYIFDGNYILLGEDGSVVTENGNPILQYIWGKFWVNNHAHVIQGKNGIQTNLAYVILKNTSVSEIITGGVQPKISQSNLNSVPIIIPSIQTVLKINHILESIFNHVKIKIEYKKIADNLHTILHSKITNIRK
jgi:type I restriction enzyme S subunit